MTDKDFNTQKQRIRKLIKKWHKTLGLNWFRIEYVYSRERHSDGPSNYEPEGDWDTAADCLADANYLTATITFYLPNLVNIKDDELEEIYLHECMHVFLKPMQTKQKAAEEERVATMLARAMVWAGEFIKPEKKDKPTSRRPRKMPQKRLKKDKKVS